MQTFGAGAAVCAEGDCFKTLHSVQRRERAVRTRRGQQGVTRAGRHQMALLLLPLQGGHVTAKLCIFFILINLKHFVSAKTVSSLSLVFSVS